MPYALWRRPLTAPESRVATVPSITISISSWDAHEMPLHQGQSPYPPPKRFDGEMEHI
jgi:hypothetical protein